MPQHYISPAMLFSFIQTFFSLYLKSVIAETLPNILSEIKIKQKKKSIYVFLKKIRNLVKLNIKCFGKIIQAEIPLIFFFTESHSCLVCSSTSYLDYLQRFIRKLLQKILLLIFLLKFAWLSWKSLEDTHQIFPSKFAVEFSSGIILGIFLLFFYDFLLMRFHQRLFQ